VRSQRCASARRGGMRGYAPSAGRLAAAAAAASCCSLRPCHGACAGAAAAPASAAGGSARCLGRSCSLRSTSRLQQQRAHTSAHTLQHQLQHQLQHATSSATYTAGSVTGSAARLAFSSRPGQVDQHGGTHRWQRQPQSVHADSSSSIPVQVDHTPEAEVARGLLRVLPLCFQPLPLHVLLQRQLQGLREQGFSSGLRRESNQATGAMLLTRPQPWTHYKGMAPRLLGPAARTQLTKQISSTKVCSIQQQHAHLVLPVGVPQKLRAEAPAALVDAALVHAAQRRVHRRCTAEQRTIICHSADICCVAALPFTASKDACWSCEWNMTRPCIHVCDLAWERLEASNDKDADIAQPRYLHAPFVSAWAKKPLSGILVRFGCCCGFSASLPVAAQQHDRRRCVSLLPALREKARALCMRRWRRASMLQCCGTTLGTQQPTSNLNVTLQQMHLDCGYTACRCSAFVEAVNQGDLYSARAYVYIAAQIAERQLDLTTSSRRVPRITAHPQQTRSQRCSLPSRFRACVSITSSHLHPAHSPFTQGCIALPC
jgi:hypothetical protein